MELDRLTYMANQIARNLAMQGEARAVVLIVPGFNSHSGQYGWAAEQLAADGLAVYAIDLRGRGVSDGERFYVDKFAVLLLEPTTKVTGNTAPTGGGIFSDSNSSVTVSANATVAANSPGNCVIGGALFGICPA